MNVFVEVAPAALLLGLLTFFGDVVGGIAFMLLFIFQTYAMFFGAIKSKGVMQQSHIERQAVDGKISAIMFLVLLWWYVLILNRKANEIPIFMFYPNATISGVMVAEIIKPNSIFVYIAIMMVVSCAFKGISVMRISRPNK